jgi:hypothetical protein
MRHHIALAIACGFLSACASGGTGEPVVRAANGPVPLLVPPIVVPFTSWQAVPTGLPVVLSGSSREAAVAAVGSRVTRIAAPSAFAPGASVTETINADGIPVEIKVTAAQSGPIDFEIGWSLSQIGISRSDSRLQYIEDFEGNNDADLANPYALGWNYQTFGVWRTSFSTSIGTLTVGIPSSAASIPTTGTATYRGFAAGRYIRSDGILPVTATVTATADFVRNNVALALTDSTVFVTNQFAPNADLNLFGTLSNVPGANALAGPVGTKGGGPGNVAMTGTADGYFYGPGATELGGVFWVNGGADTAYAGAFGARQ